MFVKRTKVVLLRGIIAFVFVFRAKFFLQKNQFDLVHSLTKYNNSDLFSLIPICEALAPKSLTRVNHVDAYFTEVK